MKITSAEKDDIEQILTLDHHYVADAVWQISVVNEQDEEFISTLRTTSLSSENRMPAAFRQQALHQLIYKCDYLWVAREDNYNAYTRTNTELLVGYVGLSIQSWNQNGWVACLGINPNYRRRKIASRLIDVAIAQVRTLNLRTISAEVTTKNVPATRFFQSRGFRLCGYSDGFHGAEEIVLFLSLRVK